MRTLLSSAASSVRTMHTVERPIKGKEGGREGGREGKRV
jgi:hypothetical protein